MGSLQLRNLGAIASVPLFSNLNFTIAEGDRVGLVAGNGGGKTTLLRCLAGRAEPTTGDVVLSRGLRVGYVEQDVPDALLDLTLREAVLDTLAPESREAESWRVDVALDEFATPAELMDRPVRELSGGWQRLMLIARVWVHGPDALLLDEPTNHLDLEKLIQVADWINAVARNIPVVIASHDRDFLDATTNRTLFLRSESSRYFALSYSRARAALAESDAADEVRLGRDLKEAKQLRKQASKLTNIGINSGSDLLTVKAKYLKDRAAKIEEAARPANRERSGDIRLTNSGTHAKVLLTAEALAVTTPAGAHLFRVDKLHVFQGDRIVLLGRNGVGKSLLVQMIHRAIVMPDAVPGVKVSPTLVLGYADQQMSQLNATDAPHDYIAGFGVGDQRTRALLAGAGLPIEKQLRPISELSFGQRARLALLGLRLTEPNFYLLDEPTNHVDNPGQEALEDEICAHGATTILVSHDRSFVRATGTRFLEIANGRLIEVDSADGFFTRMGAGSS